MGYIPELAKLNYKIIESGLESFSQTGLEYLESPENVRMEDLIRVCEHFRREFEKLDLRGRKSFSKELIWYILDFCWTFVKISANNSIIWECASSVFPIYLVECPYI